MVPITSRPALRPLCAVVVLALVAILTGATLPARAAKSADAGPPATRARAAAVGLYPATASPAAEKVLRRAPVEVGMRFRPLADGNVVGVEFYKTWRRGSATPSRGSLWASDGTRLATGRFTPATRRGWIRVKFERPVPVRAKTKYTVSVRSRSGQFTAAPGRFTAAKVSDQLKAPGGRNGVIRRGKPGGMPVTQAPGDADYFVDVRFKPASVTPPPPPPKGGIIVLGRWFPDATTTGVPDGTPLTPYTGPCSIQTNNVVIEAKIVDCDLRVLAQNVTISRSVINGTIYSDPGYYNGSFTLTDSEVRMRNGTGTGVGDVNFKMTRVEVTGGSRSVNCATNCTVEDSYLHGQYTDLRGIDHESAIRMGAGSTIRHNTITCDARPVPPDAGCSAALTGYGDFAIVEKNTIDNNLIDGGPDGSMGYCAYGGSTTGKPYSAGVNNIRFTNNIFMRGPSGKCGIWGPITSFDSRAPGNVWENNLWDDGRPVPPSN